jgi:MFS family permease
MSESATQTEIRSTADQQYRRRRAKAIASAYLGFTMDSYSIVIPTVALVPAIAYFQQGADAGLAALFTAMTLAATLVGRPLGSIIFGALADRVGRQKIGFVTIAGFGVVTLLIACLPGADLLGPAGAIALLLSLRFIDGVFLGGEYTAATPMAIEYASARRRGLFGGVVQSAASMGQVLAALITALVLAFLTSGDVSSQYTQWGWRIPFVVGGIIAILTAVFLRREVDDSDVQKVARKATNPLKELFTTRANVAAFVQMFVLMTGAFFMTNLVAAVLGPAMLLRNPDTVTAGDFTLVNGIAAFLGISGYIGSGYLSDRIGRRRALLVGAVFSGIAGPIAILAITSGTLPNAWALGAFYTLAIIGVGSIVGVAPSYFNERFPTTVRSSGWGIGYSLALVIPAFSAVYIGGLQAALPDVNGGALLWAGGSVLVIIGLFLGPETRGLDLSGGKRVALS